MKKQSGISADDLWIAYGVASARPGLTGETLLAARGRKGAWKEVVTPLGLSEKSLGKRFTAGIAAGASPVRLAQDIVDGVLVKHRLLGEQELAALRKEWASNQEVIIVALIAAKGGRLPIRMYREVKSGTMSWGTLLSEARIEPEQIPFEFASLLKSSSR